MNKNTKRKSRKNLIKQLYPDIYIFNNKLMGGSEKSVKNIDKVVILDKIITFFISKPNMINSLNIDKFLKKTNSFIDIPEIIKHLTNICNELKQNTYINKPGNVHLTQESITNLEKIIKYLKRYNYVKIIIFTLIKKFLEILLRKNSTVNIKHYYLWERYVRKSMAEVNIDSAYLRNHSDQIIKELENIDNNLSRMGDKSYIKIYGITIYNKDLNGIRVLKNNLKEMMNTKVKSTKSHYMDDTKYNSIQKITSVKETMGRISKRKSKSKNKKKSKKYKKKKTRKLKKKRT